MRAAEFKKNQRGEVSIFLCLIFMIMLSLVGALLESVSVWLTKNRQRIDLELALESAFGEYHQDLLENYELFSLDGTYGMGEYKEDLFLERLDYYGADSTENDIYAVEFLSDNQGTPFYRSAVQYIRNQYGIKENASESEGNWEEIARESETYQQEVETNEQEMEDMLAETEESLPTENNPIPVVEEVKKQGLLKIVLPEDMTVSNLQLPGDELASVRSLKKGSYPQTEEGDLIADAMFREYLLEQFQSYESGEQARSMSYQLEYLLCGKEKDAKNLEKVLQKILLLRAVPNYACLLTDTTRKNEANLLATTLCSALQVAGLAPVVEQAILLAWAYGESVAELQILMDGGEIASVKTKDRWILSLAELPLIGSKHYTKEDGEKAGMDYKEYLRVLLLLTSRETLCMRALDLIERDTGIRADSCITRIQIKSVCSLRRGLRYEFCTQYAYR